MAILGLHSVGLLCGFLGGLLLSYEAFAYLHTKTYALARSEQRIERGYGTFAPSEEEMEKEIRETYVPRVRRRKYVEAVGFALIAIGFLFEFVSIFT
jgi:hypothetical protein